MKDGIVETEVTLLTIDRAARSFADAHSQLAAQLCMLNDTIEALTRNAMPEIRKALRATTEAKGKLTHQVDAARHLFDSPRTVVMHGIKLGLQKSKGGIDIDDEGKTVALIRKHLPELADTLIKVEETPIKKALEQLPVADLKRIGCEVMRTTDQVVIKVAGSDVEKLVKRFALEAEETEAV